VLELKRPWQDGTSHLVFALCHLRSAWIPTLVIRHADGRFTRLEGDPCGGYAAALAASWRLRPTPRDREPA
jgi:hypothetical protein